MPTLKGEIEPSTGLYKDPFLWWYRFMNGFKQGFAGRVGDRTRQFTAFTAKAVFTSGENLFQLYPSLKLR